MNLFDLYEYNRNMILASEDWADIYREDEKSFNNLVKAEAKLSKELFKYFKDLSTRAPKYINWYAYDSKLRELQAADNFNVDVIVQEIPDTESGLIMQVIYQPIEDAVKSGVDAGEQIYRFALPDETVDQFIAREARSRVAYLVGKRVDREGNIVPAKNPQYHINNVTRDKIRESIRTSLSIGEDQKAASERIANIVKDPVRAERIAATEAVNAYQGGEYRYAKAAGAVKKEWNTLAGACETCIANASVGEIDIDDAFPSGDQAPSAHPWDRCGLRYIFPEQLEN